MAFQQNEVIVQLIVLMPCFPAATFGILSYCVLTTQANSASYPQWYGECWYDCELACLHGVQDASGQAIGFLLGSLGVTVALTSDACYKGLPKTPAGDVITFRGTTQQS